ncbi:MAG: hypothetical protein AB1757_01260 [Acidobacteriota bacterium]
MNYRLQKIFFGLITIVSLVGLTWAAPLQGERAFTGTINKTLRIKMTLAQDGQRLSGSYYYERVGKAIVLNGTVSGQQFTLKEFDESGKPTGTFKGRFVTASSIEGIWTNADGSKSFPFALTASGSETTPVNSAPASGIDGRYERLDAEGRIEKVSGAEINVKALANGMAQIEGEAVLVIDARRGNVRTGNVSGTFNLSGNKLLIKEGDDEYSCKMTIVFGAGKLEVTEDNGQCGGLGVSFIGDYKRTGAAKFMN